MKEIEQKNRTSKKYVDSIVKKKVRRIKPRKKMAPRKKI